MPPIRSRFPLRVAASATRTPRSNCEASVVQIPSLLWTSLYTPEFSTISSAGSAASEASSRARTSRIHTDNEGWSVLSIA